MLLDKRKRRSFINGHISDHTPSKPRKKKAKTSQSSAQMTVYIPTHGNVTIDLPQAPHRSHSVTHFGVSDRFAWVAWEGEERHCIVYKLQQRGQYVLVLCCTQKDHKDCNNDGFLNEISFDYSAENVHYIPEDAIGSTVQVSSWTDLHRKFDSVKDHYFYTEGNDTEKCGGTACKSPILGSKFSYVVCHNEACAQAFHATCLSGRPRYDMDHNLCTETSEPLDCPKCHTRVQRLEKTAKAQSKYSMRLSCDVGTTRMKVKAIDSAGTEAVLLDNTMAPEPIASFDMETKTVHFELRTGNNVQVIAPIKKLLCGLVQVPEGFDLSSVLKLFFERVTNYMFSELQSSILDRSDCDISFALACPSGLDLTQQTVLLNGILQSHPKVEPIVLNEGLMGLYGGRKQLSSHAISGPRRVVAVDMGGYTMDCVVVDVPSDPQHCDRVFRTASVYCGAEWFIDQLTNWVFDKTTDPRARIRARIAELLKDEYRNMAAECSYQPEDAAIPKVNLREIWDEKRSEQLERQTHALQQHMKFVDQQSISEFVITGGGAADSAMKEGTVREVESYLQEGVREAVVPKPQSTMSTVLNGVDEYLDSLKSRQNYITVLLESATTDDKVEHIVLQLKDEPMTNPVLPVSRGNGTIIYDIEPGDDWQSRLELLATTDEVPTSISPYHYQVADLSNAYTWSLGAVEVNLGQPHEDAPKYMAQVVSISVNEGHGAAKIESLLLAAKGKEGDWRTWNISETMTIDAIKSLARTEDCKFEVICAYGPAMCALNVDSNKDSIQFQA